MKDGAVSGGKLRWKCVTRRENGGERGNFDKWLPFSPEGRTGVSSIEPTICAWFIDFEGLSGDTAVTCVYWGFSGIGISRFPCWYAGIGRRGEQRCQIFLRN